MPRSIRFHLDENVPRGVATGLRRHGVDVTSTPDAGLLERADDAQIDFSTLEGRVLFTQDDDFLVIHASGFDHNGIAYCRKQSKPVGAMIQALLLLWEVYEPEEMRRRVEFL